MGLLSHNLVMFFITTCNLVPKPSELNKDFDLLGAPIKYPEIRNRKRAYIELVMPNLRLNGGRKQDHG